MDPDRRLAAALNHVPLNGDQAGKAASADFMVAGDKTPDNDTSPTSYVDNDKFVGNVAPTRGSDRWARPSNSHRWRMGLARFFILVTAMPLLTLLVGAPTGTLQSPAEGWLGLVGSYLFRTFIFGLLIVNLWEETAWGGFMQSRLMALAAY